MKKICVAPFTKREYPILEILSQRYEIMALITPKGIGFSGIDVSELYNVDPIGYSFMNDVEQGIQRSDVVLISDVPDSETELRLFAVSALKTALKECKDIICCLNITDQEKDFLKTKFGKTLENCRFLNPSMDCIDERYDQIALFHFDVPVLYVYEEVPGFDGYDAFLGLANSLRKSGKNVLAISEDVYNPVLGFDTIQFLVNSEPENQVHRINWLVQSLYKEKCPDIIIIRLPTPMMKYDDNNPFDFGITAYVVSQAVPGDGCIYCVSAEGMADESWKLLEESVLIKFGYPILGIHVSNQLIDESGDLSMSSIRIPQSSLNKILSAMNQSDSRKFYHLLWDSDLNLFAERIHKDFFDLSYGVI